MQVKGKSEPEEVSALLGPRDKPFDEDLLRALEIYEDGFRKFRARDFSGAAELFAKFLKRYPKTCSPTLITTEPVPTRSGAA